MWDCASQLLVPGRSCVHGRPYLNFCPTTLQHFNLRSWWVCRWMPIWKRSRLVPFLSWWGHRKGGLGGGGARGSSPKIVRAYPNFFFWRLLYIHRIYMVLANPNISVFYNHIAIAQIPGLSILLEEPGGKASNLYFLPPNTLYFNAIT